MVVIHFGQGLLQERLPLTCQIIARLTRSYIQQFKEPSEILTFVNILAPMQQVNVEHPSGWSDSFRDHSMVP